MPLLLCIIKARVDFINTIIVSDIIQYDHTSERTFPSR